MKICIDQRVFALFPELSVQGLIALNLKDESLITPLNTSSLKISSEDAKAVVKQWKDAYKKFPSHKKARPSIEYLTWVLEKEKLRKISPLVDLYNHASLLSLSPFGGEDIDKLNGALTLALMECFNMNTICPQCGSNHISTKDTAKQMLARLA